MPPLFSSLMRSSSPMRASSPMRGGVGMHYGQYSQHDQQHGSAAHQQQPLNTSGVQVLVRVRPPLPRELMYDSGVDVRPPHDIKVYNDTQEFSGRYNYVFGEETPQVDVYEKVCDCVPLALDGYNSTIFAYGQTGTGKTFTMMGDDPTVEGGVSSTGPGAMGPGGGGPGIIPRAVKELFREAKAKQDAQGAAIQVIVSYMEIYNDRLHDLLQPYKPQNARDPADVNQKRALLEVREDAKGNTFVPNLLCVKVKSYKSVYQLIAKGNRNRAVRHTEMNQASSRSHAILQLVIEQWPNGGADGTVIRSKLNFVDLAGSERWNTAAGMGWEGGPDLYGDDRVNEMTAINGSLSALGSVVAALTERRTHIPYRDSRLTHLLQDSLGGNCRTTVLATLSPSVDVFEESCSTLRFADRASAIANNPVVNASRDVGSILALKEREILRLRNMLSKFTGGDGTAATGTGIEGVDAARLAEELEETRKALEMERALRAELQQRLHNAGPNSVGGADGSAGEGIVLDATTVLSLGTPATAFDAAGTPPARPGSSLRSSAGSGGSVAGGGGGPRGTGGNGGGAASTADFFRLSTPSTPLNSVPAHLSSAAGRAASSPSSSTVLTPTRIGGSGGTGAPPTLGRSRSNLLNEHGPPGSSGGGSGPSPPRRRADMRRLSFDEAIISIKSQILRLTAQERSRFKARQPPQRGNWGGLPPPPAPGVAPPLAPSTSTSAIPQTLTGRTRAAIGIYGSTSGAASAAAPPPPPPHQQQRPPGLTLAPGVVGPAPLGGAGGNLAPMHSIEMTDSPTGSDRPSPGSVFNASSQLRHYIQQAQQATSSTRSGPAAASAPQRQQQSISNQQAHCRLPDGDHSPVSPGGPRGAAANSGRRGKSSTARSPGRGSGRSPGRDEGAVYEEDFEDDRRDSGSSVEEESEESEEGEKRGRKGRRRTEEEEDDEVEDEDDEVEGEEEMVEEEVESDSDDGRQLGRERIAGPRVGAGKGAAKGGGGSSVPGKRRSESDSGSAASSSEGGLSQLDAEEYEAIMREAREALVKAGKASGTGRGQADGPRPEARQPAAGAGAGLGGGRSAMLQQQAPSAAPVSGGGATAVAVTGTGWGRNALLNKFADVDGHPAPTAGGGGAFGRNSFLAVSAVPAPLSPTLASAVTAAAPAAGAGGGWGRRSILAAQSVATLPPPPPPQPAQPPASADAARLLRQPSPGGRRALVAELMADNRGGGGGIHGLHSYRGRSPQRGGGGSKARSQSVGGIGRPNGGSRGGASDRVSKLDAGSWIYILGASASSTRAKHLASALLLDPRTGLPAL